MKQKPKEYKWKELGSNEKLAEVMEKEYKSNNLYWDRKKFIYDFVEGKFSSCDWAQCDPNLLADFITNLLKEQLEYEKRKAIKVIWNDICEQIKKDNLEKISNNLEKWGLDYMALGNHNLEYNKRTPPIWEYLKEEIKKL